ncbi:MAG TPA: tetratricopeptide repeat protein [Gemmatimonadaceae bacterium]|nr:tetratricopeptide repeat protein [Gemmatimonadaceae bacterium]
MMAAHAFLAPRRALPAPASSPPRRSLRTPATGVTVLSTVVMVIAALTPARAIAQQAGHDSTVSGRDTLPSACPAALAPATASTNPAHVRQLMRDGLEAELTGDMSHARDMFAQAATLAPQNADIAYHLARAHDALGEKSAALAAYCRYVALAPSMDDAADVRARIAALAPAHPAPVTVAERPPLTRTPGDSTARRAGGATAEPVALSPRTHATRSRGANSLSPLPKSPAGALARGLLLPGMGQFYTDRPVAGALVLGAVTGAVYVALRPHDVRTTESFDGPFGAPHEFVRTTTERPNFTAGIVSAAVITVLGAVEAYHHASGRYDALAERRAAQRERAAADRAPAPVVTASGGALGIGLALRF